MQFIDADPAPLPVSKKFEIFGPDFKYYSQSAERDAMYAEIGFMVETIGSKVFCDANQKAVSAYFTEAALPGIAKIKHKDLVVTLVAKKDQ